MNFFRRIRGLGNIKLFRSLFVYVFATFFNQGVSFLLLPVFTYYLTPADYGILSLINTTISVLTIFIMVGSDSSIRKQFYTLPGADYASFFSSSLVVCAYAFVIISAITAITAPWINAWLGIPVKWFLLTPAISFLSIVPTLLQGQNRVQKKAFAYAVFTNSFTVTNLLLGLLFVAVLQLGYAGRVMSLLLVNLVFTCIALYLLHKQNLLTKNIKKNHIRFSLHYGLPIIPNLASVLVLAYADRIFITRMVNVNELGIYNVAYTLSSAISVLVGAFTLAYTPFLFENLKTGKREDHLKIVRISYLFLAALLLSLLALIMVSDFIYEHFINYRYAKGIKYIFWLGLGTIFFGMYKLVAGFIFYYNKTKYLAFLGIVNIIINVLLNYILIGAYGVIGAAYATAISYFLMFVFTFIISHRIIKMPWLSREIFKFK